MPRVSPFTGLLFDESVAGPLDLVTAPPYDSISAENERRLHSASPHNVVRLILGRDEPGDDDQENKYTRASRLLREWRDQGALAETDGPSWFLYELRFAFQGADRRIRGVVAAVDIEPLGGAVVPHERTLPGPIADRMQLLRTVRANLSPVYALWRGPTATLAEIFDEVARDRPPDRAVSDEQGVEHRMWELPAGTARGEAEAPWDRIERDLAAERLLIADGHHRYSVAQAFREEMRAEHGPGPWDRMMMLLVDAAIEDPPVLPIHRVVLNGDAGGLALEVPARLEIPASSAAVPAHARRVRDLAEVLAALDDDALVYGSATREGPDVVHRVAHLDGDPPVVCALHEQVLGDAALRFMPDAAAAEEAVRLGDSPAAYFLPPTHVGRIRAVIERGDTLPQKSTYFWPKPRTGMVIRPFE
jgi:uncharacterized protein (DUF1015 family)